MLQEEAQTHFKYSMRKKPQCFPLIIQQEQHSTIP